MSEKSKKITAAIYSSITTQQDTIDKLEKLRLYAKNKKYQVVKEFIDEASDWNELNINRFELKRMTRCLSKSDFEILIIYSFREIANSINDLLKILSELERSNISLISYRENIDTTLPNGHLVFNTIKGIIEVNKDIIVKPNKKRKGRKPKDIKLRYEAIIFFKNGISFREIGRRLGVSESTVRNWVK